MTRHFVELAALGIVVALSAFRPAWLERAGRPGLQAARRLGRHPRLVIVAVALLAAGGSAATAYFFLWPRPTIHDEFSYLLAGDTFAQGRLSNPTPDHAEHFETFHVLTHPTYQSKYPPGNALPLALGQRLGDPVYGLWIAAAFMIGAIAWMLFGWLPPRWATVGAFVALARFGIATYWTQSYWGGAVAAGGGALLLGAVPRLRRDVRLRDAVIAGIGVVMLANTRPWIGLLMTAIVMTFVFVRGARRHSTKDRHRMFVGIAGVIGLGVVGMATYNHAVTGDMFRLPYQVHDATVPTCPLFLWQATPREIPPHPVPEIHAFWREEIHRHQELRTDRNLLLDTLRHRISNARWFFLGRLLVPLLLVMPWVVWRRRFRLATLVSVVAVAGILVTTFYRVHYLAPITGAVVLLLVGGLRYLFLRRGCLAAVGRSVAMGLLVATAIDVASAVIEAPHASTGFAERRAAIERDLAMRGGRHLVLIRYAPDHVVHFEWVQNGASLFDQQIVWARDLGDERNRALLDDVENVGDRTVWRFAPDEGDTRVIRRKQ